MGLFRDLKKLIDEGAQQLNTKLDGHQQQGRQSGYQGQGQQGQSHRPGTVLRSHYLVQTYTPGSSQPVLVPIQWPYPGNLPQDALVFSFTHPDPASNEQTRFFLDCLPDPIGMAYHCMLFARSRLIMQGSNPPWRHRVVNISLKDEDGLAWVSGNDMTISLRWARNILSDYKNGRRDMPGCCFEFKGVIQHELVHIVQFDGNHTAPGWLTESIADSVRYASGLGAKHWRKPGEGKPHCGWEDAYDAGALFLCWLTGETPEVDARPGEPTQPIQQQQQQPTGTYSAQQPFATQYPQNPGTGAGPPAVPAGRPNPNARARRGPFPDIVRTLDTRLRTQRFSEQWWVELTGASLEQLWREYQDYYRK